MDNKTIKKNLWAIKNIIDLLYEDEYIADLIESVANESGLTHSIDEVISEAVSKLKEV